MTRQMAVALAVAALTLGACTQTAKNANETIEFGRNDVKQDVGEHTGGLVGRDYQWREAQQTASLEAMCADIGISASDDNFGECMRILDGAPNHMSYDEFQPPHDPRKWLFLTDYVNSQWFGYRAYRAAYVKKSQDRDTHWHLSQGFLEKQRQLLKERELMGPAYTAGGM